MARHAPGHPRFARVVDQGYQRGYKGLEQVAAYLNDMIVFHSNLTAHVKTRERSPSTCASIRSSFPPRKAALRPWTLIVWAIPFYPQVCARTRKNCPH